MALTQAQLADQKKQAEELLFSETHDLGFAKSLFFGRFQASLVFPYPTLADADRSRVDAARKALQTFARDQIDAAAIDREADIPREVIAGLGKLGVLGMTAPPEFGGLGFSQLGYTKIMEILGGHCASTAVFVNAHHSIGIRALVLFGTEEQKRRWLPDLVSGKKLAAFALTEPEAGSDAANVQTRAVLSPDGKTWLLTGQKRYITNGAIADVLTVMARTPVPGSTETKVTAFLVTPDMAGFKVVEARMPKCGIRGTATARLAFNNMAVPAENVLGPLGKGLKVALTVLDFGRTTFGASCTGAAKFCLEGAVRHARERVQFKQSLGEFELIKKKLAFIASHAFAIESMTAQCAAFIDRGAEDFMLETAMLKVFSTEHLWTIVNETLQIYGGQGYFSDEPYERMMRDARINLIGEGANEVLKSFIAVVGMREVGEHLKSVQAALSHPWEQFAKLFSFGQQQMAQRFTVPSLPVHRVDLKASARHLGSRVREFGLAVQEMLFHVRSQAGTSDELKMAEIFLKSQHQHERIANIACDLYASSCVLARLEAKDLSNDAGWSNEAMEQAGRHFLTLSDRRMRSNFDALKHNDDFDTNQTADVFLKG